MLVIRNKFETVLNNFGFRRTLKMSYSGGSWRLAKVDPGSLRYSRAHISGEVLSQSRHLQWVLPRGKGTWGFVCWLILCGRVQRGISRWYKRLEN